MSSILLDELETILNETNHVKYALNVICGTVWDLLNPPETENNEVKASSIKVNDSDSQIVTSCDDCINIPTSLEESLESVTKLLALGKLVRGATRNEKKAENSVLGSFSKTFPNKENLQKVTKLQDKSTNRSCNLVQKGGSLQRHSGTKKSESSQFNKDSSDENPLHKKGQHTVSGTQIHACSLKFSNFVRTLKMPEDLRGILKLYYHYETFKENLNTSDKSAKCGPQIFFQRFHNLVKLKLNCDLKANIKQTERYVKYLNISDGITQDASNKNLGENCHRMDYSSLEDLNKYEERRQKLMELKIKIRILNLLSDQMPQYPV